MKRSYFILTVIFLAFGLLVFISSGPTVARAVAEDADQYDYREAQPEKEAPDDDEYTAPKVHEDEFDLDYTEPEEKPNLDDEQEKAVPEEKVVPEEDESENEGYYDYVPSEETDDEGEHHRF